MGIFVAGRIKYVDRPGYVAPKPQKTPRGGKTEKGAATKIDPKYLAAARELRDRWMEQVNDAWMLPAPAGKYAVNSIARRGCAAVAAACGGVIGPRGRVRWAAA